MGCILNYCREPLWGDLLVVAFYGAAVTLMLVLATLARLKSLRMAAALIGWLWVVGLLYFFYFDGPLYFPAAIFFDVLLARVFWRMSQDTVFATPLCVILIVEIAFNLSAIALSIDAYWRLFVLNRLFELTLLYVMGCSIFRIRLRRAARRGSPHPKGWRADFSAT